MGLMRRLGDGTKVRKVGRCGLEHVRRVLREPERQKKGEGELQE